MIDLDHAVARCGDRWRGDERDERAHSFSADPGREGPIRHRLLLHSAYGFRLAHSLGGSIGRSVKRFTIVGTRLLVVGSGQGGDVVTILRWLLGWSALDRSRPFGLILDTKDIEVPGIDAIFGGLVSSIDASASVPFPEPAASVAMAPDTRAGQVIELPVGLRL